MTKDQRQAHHVIDQTNAKTGGSNKLLACGIQSAGFTISAPGCFENPRTPPPVPGSRNTGAIRSVTYQKQNDFLDGCRITSKSLVRNHKPAPLRVVGGDPNLCHKHRRGHCLSCLFYIDTEKGVWQEGRVLQDPKVTSPENWAEQPLLGGNAVFKTAAHRPRAFDKPRRGAISKVQGLAEKSPPLIGTDSVPDKFWFVYCPQCQLTYLVGSEGHKEASNHPAHLAQSETQQRYVTVFIDGESTKIVTKDGEDDRWNGRFSAYYGPNSQFNGGAIMSAYSDESHLLYVALSNTLAHFADQSPVSARLLRVPAARARGARAAQVHAADRAYVAGGGGDGDASGGAGGQVAVERGEADDQGLD
ncbi:hypothetical protein PG985_013711 [Apiospora marii]|uniref:uncharacterized protein n=1 Tax=Apiospora marii TaxID=335849 RepID=UPI00312F05D7